MEQEKGEPESKRLNEGLVEYMRKRSVQEVPRYTVQLKKYISVREKRARAAFSRRNSELGRQVRSGPPGKKGSGNSNGHDAEQSDKAVKENRDDDNDDRGVTRRRSHNVRSRGGSRGPEPRDWCCRKRCRRMGRPVCCPRRRSCRRRRRSCRRRRRRSCRRRRRRRSCRRRRRRRC